jgi:hypothetical protein
VEFIHSESKVTGREQEQVMRTYLSTRENREKETLSYYMAGYYA